MLRIAFFIFEQGKIYKPSKPRQGKIYILLELTSGLLQPCAVL